MISLGKSSDRYQVILEPFDPPLGLNSAYCRQNIETLVIRQNVHTWSGDDFNIKNEAGEDVLNCYADPMSWKLKKGAQCYDDDFPSSLPAFEG